MAAAALIACGGQVAGGLATDGGPATGNDGGSASGGGTHDSGSGGSCSVGSSETCSDGTTYSVNCSCPAATCTCSEMSGQSGSSGGGIPFSGCVSQGCDPSALPAAYQACGFPVPGH